MRWPIAVVAGLALDAGWNRDDAVTAVAVAMATSGGDDAWFLPALFPGDQPNVGLWGVPVPPGDSTAPLVLLQPKANAEAAHSLYVASDGTWSWALPSVELSLDQWGAAAVEAVGSPRYGIDQVEATIGQAVARAQAAVNAAGMANLTDPGVIG